MANENRIQIILTTDASGAVTGISLADDAQKKLGETTKKSSSEIQAAWNAISVKVASWMYVIEKAKGYWDAFMSSVTLGAKAMQAEESFRIAADAANINADRMIAAMRRASAGTIDESDIMQKAIKGIVQDLGENQLVLIMEAARVSARIAGEDVRAAYETITDAIANNMPRALRKYGLLAKEDISLVNQALAAGIEDVRIYELAMANAAKQAAILGIEEQSVAEKIQEHNANMQNIMEQFGKYAAVIWDFLRGPGKEYKDWLTELVESGQLGDVGGVIEGYDITGHVAGSKESKIAFAEDQKRLIVEQTKAAIEAKKNAEKAIAAADAYADWAVQVANLNPGLNECEKKLADINRQADVLVKKGVARAKVEETRALAEYYLKIADQIKESEKSDAEVRKIWEDRYKAEGEYTREVTMLRADVVQKRILGEEEAAHKLKEIAFRSSETVEEYLVKEEEITRLYEERKLLIRDEYRIRREKEVYEKEAAARQRIMQMSMSGTGEAGDLQTGLQMFQQGMWGIFNQAQGTDPYSMELERLRLFWEEKTNLYLQGQATIAEANDAWNAYNLMQAQQTDMMRLQSAQYMTQSMLGIMSMLYNATGKQSQALFYMMKAAAVAQAIVNAWVAYTQALATPMGVWSGGAYAKMVLAMGLAGAAAIAATAFMSPSTGAGTGGTATGGTAPVVQTTETATEATEQKAETRPLVVNFYNYGFMTDEIKDELAREFVPALQKAVNDGAH